MTLHGKSNHGLSKWLWFASFTVAQIDQTEKLRDASIKYKKLPGRGGGKHGSCLL